MNLNEHVRYANKLDEKKDNSKIALELVYSKFINQ